MNILIDKLPTTVLIDDIEYEINTDFRVGILFSIAMNDNSLSDEEKCETAIRLYYKVVPHNIQKAIEQILLFYSCNKQASNSSESSNSCREKVFDYEIDANYIYSAFLTQYNIDLNSVEYLHWFKFKALFDSLDENLMLCKIIKYRSIDLNKIKDKDEKNYYKKMKETYAIKDEISQEELEELQELENFLLGGE